MATTVKSILMRAKKLLIEKGWIKGKMIDAKGQMCAVGALHEAAKTLPFQIFISAKSRLLKFTPNSTVNLTKYNDNSTKEDILQLFDKAIQNKNKE